MRTAALVSVFAIVFAAGAGTASAQAKPADADKPANKAEAQAQADMRMVIQYIDLGEYKPARDSLKKTLGALTAAGSGVRPIAAKTHSWLGTVYIVGFKDTKKATEHFTTAINIDKEIALPEFADDRTKVVFGKAYEEVHPTIECGTLMGLFHQAVPLAQEGTPTVIEAKADKHLTGSNMLVLYRGAAGEEFQEAAMKKVEGCTYRAEIPATSVNAPKVEYYLEARLDDGRPAARRGKSKDPYVVNVSFGPVTDAEVPEEAVEDEPETTEPARDEVEELLLNKPKPSKGSGCAGCSTGASGSGSVFFAALALLVLRRRRTS